jgi:DNA repair exonuclease SbcCD nuclease subunit
MKTLNKSLMFTDIHFGKKNNSDQHNLHCIQFIEFVCNHIKQNQDIDHVIFLGDWHENRSAINVSTLYYSYNGASLLNDLNIPIYFIIGNHDLYTKHSREVHSCHWFDELTNFIVIDHPTVVENIGNGALLSPFLFHYEYPTLNDYNVKNVYGHFEFSGFVVTGASTKFQGGPDHTDYSKFKRVFSGHFHKRQITDNVIYIGNTFPMDFSDANDFDRGFAIHDHINDDVSFINWPDCPKYISTNLSTIIDNQIEIPDGANIKCIADITMDYSKMIEFKRTIMEVYNLADIAIEEPPTQFFADGIEEIEDTKVISINDAIVDMLSKNIESNGIDNNQLIQIYIQL